MTLNHHWPVKLIKTFTILAFLHVQAGEAVQNVRLILPPFVHAGTTATLLCLYDLEGSSLYSVQWYRGRFEFFRFFPNENPQKKAFQIPGISVDVLASNTHQVTLRNIPVQISGEFSCEVTTDTPRFRTSRAVNNLTVVGMDLDVNVPRWKFLVGDVIEANCTLTPHLPMTKLKFYWNVTPIPDEFITHRQSNSITLNVNSSSFISISRKTTVPIRLTCSAILDNTYYIISKSISFQLEPKQSFHSVNSSSKTLINYNTETIYVFVIFLLSVIQAVM